MLIRKKVVQLRTKLGGKMLPKVALPSTPRKHIEGCSFSAVSVCARCHQFIVSTLKLKCFLLFNFQDRVNCHGQSPTIVTFWLALSYLLRVLFCSHNRRQNIQQVLNHGLRMLVLVTTTDTSILD
jgi:hypothetical protein